MGGLVLGGGLAPMRNLEEEETSAGSSDELDAIVPPVALASPTRPTSNCERIKLPLVVNSH